MNGYDNDGYSGYERNGRGGGYGILIVLLVLCIIVTCVAVGLVIYLVKGAPAKKTPDVTTDQTPVSDTAPAVTDEPQVTDKPKDELPKGPDANGITFTRTSVDNNEIYKGTLILVNGTHEYNFNANAKKDSEAVSLYAYWKALPGYPFKLTGDKVKILTFTADRMTEMFEGFERETGLNDYLITSGLRDYALQEETFAEQIEKYGLESVARKYCALPGFSEHHTGYAFDAYIYTDDNKTYKPGAEDMPGVYNWIYDNCWKYGFIHRYPEGKETVTGYYAEGWHFRYVGAPHAEIIKKSGYVLEEYISKIEEYTFDNYLVYECEDGSRYAIYYEPAATETVVTEAITDGSGNVIAPATVSVQYSAATDVRVPEGKAYDISGNNDGGFIVTFKLN